MTAAQGREILLEEGGGNPQQAVGARPVPAAPAAAFVTVPKPVDQFLEVGRGVISHVKDASQRVIPSDGLQSSEF